MNFFLKKNAINFIIGQGYSQSTEKLLDISNNDHYIWIKDFDPSLSMAQSTQPAISAQTTTSAGSSATDTQLSQPSTGNNSNKVLAVAIGTMIDSSLLSFGSLILYKWNKNKQYQRDTPEVKKL